MSTYTLEVPATNDTIKQLIVKIWEANHAPNARVTLNFGTCSLMCSEEAERREFGTLVTVAEAVSVLWNAQES